MISFILISSLTYFAGTAWYFLIDRRNKKSVKIIPSEFLYVILAFALFAGYVIHARDDIFFSPQYQGSYERILYTASAGICLLMVIIHAFSKYLEDRTHYSRRLSKRGRKILNFIHVRFSHKLIYLSASVSLLAFALAEMTQKITVVDPNPRYWLVSFSAVLFALSFYKTIVHGNTWRAETLTLPGFATFLVNSAHANGYSVMSGVFPKFAFLVLTLTPALLIFEKFVYPRYFPSSKKRAKKLLSFSWR